MLVRTSFNDIQVILKTNMNPAGHGGASGRYDQLHETAFDSAYFLTPMGIQN
jgi:oligopeptidase B